MRGESVLVTDVQDGQVGYWWKGKVFSRPDYLAREALDQGRKVSSDSITTDFWLLLGLFGIGFFFRSIATRKRRQMPPT